MTAKGANRIAGPPAPACSTNPIAHIGIEPSDDLPLIPVVTFVAWTLCLAVGLLGFWLRYPRSRLLANPSVPKENERLFVQLAKQPASPAENSLPPAHGPSVAPVSEEMAPAPIPVAEPSPAIAFAVPVEGATRVVPFNQAASGRPSKPVPTVQRLTAGADEGEQPPPEYPREAIEKHQEGTVVVRLMVGEDGRVTSAAVVQPSPHPLLNESALRTIRQQWRFPPGSVRVFEKPIHFQIAPQ